MMAKETVSTSAAPDFTNPAYYTNRELSWLDFNARVLSEAHDKNIPLLERLKFLSITASNLDEFFMVRVASLKDMVNAGYTKKDFANMTADEQLFALSKKTHDFVLSQYTTYNRSFLPQLESNHLHVVSHFEDMTEEQAAFADDYFTREVYPVLTPMAVDSSRPFPQIRNKTLNIGCLIRDKKKGENWDFATVQVPSVLPRYLILPNKKGDEGTTIILLEQIIMRNIQKLYLGYKVQNTAAYRIMRNADLSIDEDEAADLLVEIKKQLKRRQWGEVIRLEIEESMDKQLLKILRKELGIKEDDIYKISGPLDLTFLMKLYGLPGFDSLRYERWVPQPVPAIMAGGPDEDIFTKIRRGDILLCHPYETFDPVVNFVQQAAKDPAVLAIKQTLYRVSSHSPIITALAQAADNGKQVCVLVELKARFDEENNILWARRLEQAGCHVIYGLLGLKTHCKITLVVRQEDDGIRRYVHLATGNYNDSTAKLYTDCGIMTCRAAIGEDATSVFNMLSGYSEPLSWNKLSLAPLWLRDRFLTLIRREAANARAGKPAHMIAKMNSLCDAGIIAALYEASAAGVKIELIIRGICCLKVGIPGVSENISVRSIVGNFLEHARIFYFENAGNPEIYMGSADWMPRNLDRRVEILFPVEDPEIMKRIMHILEVQLADNVKAHILQPDDTYVKIDKRGKVLVCAQEQFCDEAAAAARTAAPEQNPRVFIPMEAPQEN